MQIPDEVGVGSPGGVGDESEGGTPLLTPAVGSCERLPEATQIRSRESVSLEDEENK